MALRLDSEILQSIRDNLGELRARRLSENAVRTVEVKKHFNLGEHVVHALRGVTLTIKRGEYISIMGPSGSGKTTLFNLIGGLNKPSAGEVFIDEVDIAQLDPFELAWIRCRKIGYIFQDFRLILVMTALENVMLPLMFAGMSQDDARDRAGEILALVGLGDRLRHKPGRLSGGQQQRVAVARAFANSPAIILADEPTGNLDLQTGLEIIELLKKLNQDHRTTVISATHDKKMLDVSDRIVWLSDGKINRIEDRSAVEISLGEIGSIHEPGK